MHVVQKNWYELNGRDMQQEILFIKSHNTIVKESESKKDI